VLPTCIRPPPPLSDHILLLASRPLCPHPSAVEVTPLSHHCATTRRCGCAPPSAPHRCHPPLRHPHPRPAPSPQIRLLTRGNPMRRCSRVEHCATSRREGFPNNIQHSVHFTSYVSMKHIHALEGSNNRAILMRDQLLRLRLPFSSRRQPHPFGSTRRLSTIRGAPPCHTAAPPPVSRRPDILYTLNLIAKTTTPTVQILTSTATAPINPPPGEAATLRRASTVASHRPWPPPPPPLRHCPSNPF
jgi:hypothetical protein